MRIITADEMGLVKVLQLESGECLAVSPGEQARARAVRSLCHNYHNATLSTSISSQPRTFCGSIHVARLEGVVETWDMTQNERMEDKSIACALRLTRTVMDCPPEPIALACISPNSPGGSEPARILTCNGAGDVNISHAASQGGSDPPKATRFSIRGPLSAAIVVDRALASGGKENDLKLWDLNTQQCIWKAKNVPHDFLDMRQPVWISSLRSLVPEGAGGDSGRDGSAVQQIVAGTAHRQVRLYDTRAQKRPTHSIDADEHSITTMAVAPGGGEVVVADTAGLVRVLDLRKMKWGRRFEGPAGSVRGLAFHPSLPVLACVGLDRMARVYHYGSREQKFQVYLKQRLNAVLFDEEGEVPVAADARGKHEGRAAAEGKGHDWSGSDGWGSGEEYEMMDEGDSSDEDENQQLSAEGRAGMGAAINGSSFIGNMDGGNSVSSNEYGSRERQGTSDEDSDVDGDDDESGDGEENGNETGDAHDLPLKRHQEKRKGGHSSKKRR